MTDGAGAGADLAGLRVLALVPNLRGWAPGQRTTIEAWEPMLRTHGISVDYSEFETPALHDVLYGPGRYAAKAFELTRAFARRAGVVRRGFEGYDVVYLYREAALAGPALLERVVARNGPPIVYELDDPLHVPYSSAFNGPLARLKFRGKVATICRLSSAVIANSTPIRRWVEQHNSNVWQIPSVVDERDYTPVAAPRRDRVCVGWSGSPSTAPNLSVVADALVELQRRVDVEIHLIGHDRFDLPGVDFTFQRWQAETEVADLRRLDIGMVPLPDVPWNHHKFYLKAAQYMALGIVPVATPMGNIPEDIQPGRNGFTASTTEEWVDHLERLVVDEPLRAALSAQAAADAAERYTVAANEDKILGAFRSALRR